MVSCEIRLLNWDEGQYRNTNQPNPRGEVLIGGKMVTQGYFAEAEKENINFKIIDGTKYFSTGDIGEIFPDGTLKIIGEHFLFFVFFFNLIEGKCFRSKKRFD